MTLFNPIPGSTVSIAGTTATANVKLGGQPITGSFQVRYVNPGTTVAYIKFAANTSGSPTAGSAVVATASDIPVLAGERGGMTINNTQTSGDWYVAAIMASGTATVEFTSGYGD